MTNDRNVSVNFTVSTNLDLRDIRDLVIKTVFEAISILRTDKSKHTMYVCYMKMEV